MKIKDIIKKIQQRVECFYDHITGAEVDPNALERIHQRWINKEVLTKSGVKGKVVAVDAFKVCNNLFSYYSCNLNIDIDGKQYCIAEKDIIAAQT